MACGPGKAAASEAAFWAFRTLPVACFAAVEAARKSRVLCESFGWPFVCAEATARAGLVVTGAPAQW